MEWSNLDLGNSFNISCKKPLLPIYLFSQTVIYYSIIHGVMKCSKLWDALKKYLYSECIFSQVMIHHVIKHGVMNCSKLCVCIKKYWYSKCIFSQIVIHIHGIMNCSGYALKILVFQTYVFSNSDSLFNHIHGVMNSHCAFSSNLFHQGLRVVLF